MVDGKGTVLPNYELEGKGVPTLVLDEVRHVYGARIVPERGTDISNIIAILDELIAFGIIPSGPVSVVGGETAIKLALLYPERVASLTVKVPTVSICATAADIRAIPAFIRAVRQGTGSLMDVLDEYRPQFLQDLCGMRVTKAQCARLEVPTSVVGEGLVAMTLRRWIPRSVQRLGEV